MLKELKFVQGAISKKDLVPAMKHFAIEGGHVRSYNGVLALSSPIPFDIDCYPRAETLVKAINNCDETVALSLTPTGKLRVQSGAFRALISCVEKSEMHLRPTGNIVNCDSEELLKCFKILENIVGDDASRPWANGILLRGQSAFATCNVVLCEYWLGSDFPTVNIPLAAVREVVRIGEPPSHLQIDDTSVSFHYADGRWIRTQLFSTEWPDLSRILDRQTNCEAIDERIFDALDKLKPFVDKSGRVIFTAGQVATHEGEDEGGRIEIPGSTMAGIYALEMVKLLKGVATSADFTDYPQPCMFQGNRLRGAIVGRKM